MTELALLTRAFERVPEPDDATVFEARAGLLSLIAAVEDGAAPRGLQEPQRRLVLLLPRTAPRFRLALILIVLLLLVAGIATATYLGVRTWGGGPSTSQARSGYRLSVIFDLPPEKKAFYSGVTLGAGGHDLYAIHHRFGTQPHATELVRIRGIDTSTPSRPQPVLDFQDLAEPRLWDTGLDLRTDVIDDWPAPGEPRSLPVVDSRGDIFLVAAARKPGADRPEAVSLIVLRRDGGRQKVLTLGELERSGVLRTGGNPVSLVAASTAPDRLWIIATVVDPSYRKPSLHALLEVVDPNADGNWSDRVVRRIELPRSIPESTPQRNWEFPQLAVEPSRPGDNRSRSVLALAWSDEFRIYRIADRNGDGDVLDPGEVQLALDGTGAPKGWPAIAPRLVRVNGHLRRELIAVALERWGRVSVIASPTGVTDVVRSLPLVGGGWTPFAGPGRDIYLVRSGGNRLGAYRLTPTGAAQASQATPAEPRASQTPFPPTAEHAQLLVTRYNSGGYSSFWMRADGTIVRPLAPKTSWQLCQSADGRELLYTSHAEAPGEEFLYVAHADGSARKVTERPVEARCPFSARWLLFTRQSSYLRPGPLVRHDLGTGGEVEIAHDVDALSLSPDGTRVVYAGGLDYSRGWPPTEHRTIELVDLRTLRHRGLAGPPLTLAQWPRFGGLTWSPDGSRVAYMTRPDRYGRHAGPPAQWPPRQTDLWVQSVGTGDRTRVLRIVGSPPSFSWSSDGKQLLVCTEDRGTRTGCSGTHRPQGNDARLLIIDLTNGSSRVVARGPFVYAAWAPSGRAFAYASTNALYVRAGDGRVRRIASAPPGGWPAWNWQWLGWSPDGSFIGLSTDIRPGYAAGAGLTVVDVAAGRMRVVQRVQKGEFLYAVWWRPPGGTTSIEGGQP